MFEVAAADDQEPVETFRSDDADEPLRDAFACGARTGVWITAIPSLRNTSSKEAVNLLSRSWIRKAHPLEEAPEAEVARLLEDPGS